MKITSGALALVMAVGCFGTVSAVAQEARHDEAVAQQDHHDKDHHDQDESRFYSNQNYKQGWQDGRKHKHKDHKWKNDADREAYEAGYAHGDHNEEWKEHR
jgi:hypothetical protein